MSTRLVTSPRTCNFRRTTTYLGKTGIGTFFLHDNFHHQKKAPASGWIWICKICTLHFMTGTFINIWGAETTAKLKREDLNCSVTKTKYFVFLFLYIVWTVFLSLPQLHHSAVFLIKWKIYIGIKACVTGHPQRYWDSFEMLHMAITNPAWMTLGKGS